jgi:hypothetical protein
VWNGPRRRPLGCNETRQHLNGRGPR